MEFLSVLYSNLYPLLSQSYYYNYSTYNYNSTTTVNGYISLEMGQKENFLKNTTTPPCYQNKSKLLWEDNLPSNVSLCYIQRKKRRKEKNRKFSTLFSLFYIYCKTVTLLNWIDLIFEPPPLFYFLHCCYLLPTYIIREEPHIVSI